MSWQKAVEADKRPGSNALLDGYIGLVAGIVKQAGLDARKGDLSAVCWLKSEVCELFCDVLELDHYAICKWAEEKQADIEIAQAYSIPAYELP
jgi:hypothetical protein